jgi:phosphoribosylformimino-5-aminoimidazole carboxamide ribotide isomerase
LQIIPVIDLKNGQVVHAKFGQRSHYQPILSTLCDSSEPLAITAALLELYPFKTLYIADLDAILGFGDHANTIEKICENYPQLTIWLDSGVGQMNARALYKSPQIRTVIGSESIASLQDYRAISYAIHSTHVLSLDYSATHESNTGAMGIAELHDQARFWPDDTICMTLNNVGSDLGPDIVRLQALQQLNLARKKPANLFAAGGVRNIDDLLALKQLGIAGVLMASALHNGTIKSADIVQLMA